MSKSISNENTQKLKNKENGLKNNGNGAGGSKTTSNGIQFEIKTSIENKLLQNNYIKIITNPKNKYGFYFECKNKNNTIIYLTQCGYKLYFKQKFNIDVYKQPDEAFLIFSNNEYHLKILEKKNQNVSGTVEDKLKTGLFTKKEYEKMLSKITQCKFNVSYAFCVSKFLQNNLQSNKIKYITIKEILQEDNIKIFYGEDENYFDLLFEWINK